MATNVKRAETNKWGDLRDRTTGFLRSVWAELKKVHWPNRKELITYTGVVLVAVALVAMLIWMVDSVLSLLLDQLFKAVGK
ncbi:MAG: preprotein translocase subunit SecE [Syntrophomonadaceae bacterium]|nr:preprotein translocase subunit SecE [Syntrophomonadaceae bacterium]